MITDEDKRTYLERIKRTRSKFLSVYPFFGVLMMSMRYALDDTVSTACTDGTYVVFDPNFELNDNEFEIIMMHELMHVALDHMGRGRNYNPIIYNIACDTVINSCINYTIGTTAKVQGEELMHLAPDGKEGYLYSAEEVYHMMMSLTNDGQGGKNAVLPTLGGTGEKGDSDIITGNGSGSRDGDNEQPFQADNTSQPHPIDNHDRWGQLSDQRRAELAQIVEDAAESVEKSCGDVPLAIERILKQRRDPQLDWRAVLAQFVQEDLLDYSFSSPDRRYQDIILPDLVPSVESVHNILFMIDTSGSMTASEITQCYSELCGAIDQFDGRLTGLLGFFDAAIVPPVPFESVEDVLKIPPVGGGGTRVDIIFDYVRKEMTDEPPVSIIIMTDGYVSIPPEEAANGIPVLWLLTDPRSEEPGWGITARVKV